MRLFTALLVLAVLIAVSVPAIAQTTVIPKYTVIPVAIENGLNSAVSQPGDSFHARCSLEECGGFPQETRFLGEVTGVTSKYGKYPGQIEVVFVKALLPDGRGVTIDATPISLDANHVMRDPETGRLAAVSEARNMRYRFIAHGDERGTLVGTIDCDEITGGLVCPSTGWVCRAKIGKLKAVREVDVPPGTPFGIVLAQDVILGTPGAPAFSPPAGAGPQPGIFRLTFGDVRPFVSRDGVLMIPLRATMHQLEIPFQYLHGQKTVLITTRDGCVQHPANGNVLYVNGRVRTLAASSRIINHRLYVPAEAVNLLTGKTAAWNACNGVLTIE